MEYVELHARSAFSFLRGASSPASLVEEAAALGLGALALTDRDGVYGIPRLHQAAGAVGVRPITGAELTLEDGGVLPVLVRSQKGYRNLCQLLTRAHLRGSKGNAPVLWSELHEFADGLVALTGDEEGAVQRALAGGGPAAGLEVVRRLEERFGTDNVFVELQRRLTREDAPLQQQLLALAHEHGRGALRAGGRARSAGRLHVHSKPHAFGRRRSSSFSQRRATSAASRADAASLCPLSGGGSQHRASC